MRAPGFGRAANPAWALVALAAGVSGLGAQQDSLAVAEGVDLGLLYDGSAPRTVAVRPFSGAEAEAARAEAIVLRDLELSDRFKVVRSPDPAAGGPLDFQAWDRLGVDFVVDGAIASAPAGPLLQVTVQDVVYEVPLREDSFALPLPDEEDFRMAVHRVSDEIVRWITGEPGMAASRIVFPRARAGGGYDLLVVDADGEGERRIASHESLVFSPGWAPDGVRLVYTAMAPDGSYDVVELHTDDGSSRSVTPRHGLNLTPAWSADGSRLALSISVGSREDLQEYDPGSGRLRLLSRNAMEPSFAPDGGRLAYSSDRLGTSQVWLTRLDGGDPVLVSPWVARGRTSFHAPDWSPDGRVVAFHGGRALRFQILVVDPDVRGRPRQLTWEGWSETPSWAPDSRHLVVRGSRGGREGLYVLDAVTGGSRLLVPGADVRTPDWSPALSGGRRRGG